MQQQSLQQNRENFRIESLISERSSSPLEEDDSDDSDAELRPMNSTTSFTVKDILDPNKFSSASKSPSLNDSRNKEGATPVVWHPWMSATRYSRPQKQTGELTFSLECVKLRWKFPKLITIK